MVTYLRGAAGAAVAVVALATSCLAGPAQAATMQASTDGIIAIMLSDQDVKEVTGQANFAFDAVCGQITLGVWQERQTSPASRAFTFEMCVDMTRHCIAEVGEVHPQINVYPDNRYSCTTYSTDGSWFLWLGETIFG